MKYAPAEELERFVLEQLKKISNDKARIENIVKAANRDSNKALKSLTKEKRAQEQKLTPLDAQLENILDAIGKGLGKGSTVNKKISELEAHKAEIERDIENIGFEIDKLKGKQLNAHVMYESLKKFNEICDTASPEEIQKIIAQFVEMITYTPTEIKIALFDQPIDRGQLISNHSALGALNGSDWLLGQDLNLRQSG